MYKIQVKSHSILFWVSRSSILSDRAPRSRHEVLDIRYSEFHFDSENLVVLRKSGFKATRNSVMIFTGILEDFQPVNKPKKV